MIRKIIYKKIKSTVRENAVIMHILLLCLFYIIACVNLSGCNADEKAKVLHVAMPYSDFVLDPETNYYIKWLEEKTGLKLDVELIRQSRSEEYLDSLFSSDADVDVVLFGSEFEIDMDSVEKYAEKGDVYKENGIRAYLNYGSKASAGAGQILWINYEWLKKIGASVPETTDELCEVLRTFKETDCNGNGLQDEIPLAGAKDDYVFMPVELLLNSFIYNDPYHSRYLLNDKKDEQAALTDSFREGLVFCRRLYDEGLLDSHVFDMNRHELMELVNNPEDLVGAFTTDSISDVIYSGNPEIMARFIHVSPIKGPCGERNALYRTYEPKVGAIILNRSKRKEEAKLLLNTMLSEEASLIARFGEKGIDWDFSDGKDISVYGGVSTIVTKNYIWNTLQNKHLGGIGPMKVPEKYILGVTWNGINSDTEYIDGRSQMSYRDYLPDFTECHTYDADVSQYTDEAIKDFVMGIKNIGSDTEWEEYKKGLSDCMSLSR